MQRVPTPEKSRLTRNPAFRLDVGSAVLGFAPFVALNAILPYIAVNRFDAPMAWVGFMNSAVYLGLLGNAFFSAWSAGADQRRIIVALLAGSAALMAAAAFQRSAVPYCIFTTGILCSYGLLLAQYDTFLVRLYAVAERPRKLSFRWMILSAGAALMSPLFGKLGEGTGGHLPVLLCGAGFLAAGAFVFQRIPVRGGGGAEPVGLRGMFRVLSRNRRFMRLVVLMVVFAWMGTGISAIDVALYRRYAMSEFAVGLLSASNTVGMIAAALAITPFLRFRGGVSNFRLCFTTAAAAGVFFCLAGIGSLGAWGAPVIGIGNFIYGIAATGFTIASQTALANLAGEGEVVLYVNGFKFIQGVRGIVFPILVAWALQAAPIGITLVLALALTAFCAVASWIPAVDAD